MLGPYKITFGRDRYHQAEDMIEWCRKYIGEGDWNRHYADYLHGVNLWEVDQMFGNTTFRFADAKDYSKFIVKWEWANGNNRTG